MSKLIAKIKKACEDCIEDGNKAIEEVTDGSEDIYEGRMEFASQILSLVSDCDCDPINKHLCFDCEREAIKEKYPNAVYTDQLTWDRDWETKDKI